MHGAGHGRAGRRLSVPRGARQGAAMLLWAFTMLGCRLRDSVIDAAVDVVVRQERSTGAAAGGAELPSQARPPPRAEARSAR